MATTRNSDDLNPASRIALQTPQTLRIKVMVELRGIEPLTS